MLAAVLPAVRAVDGVIDVETRLDYAIDDTRLRHDGDQLETAKSRGPPEAAGDSSHPRAGPWSLCRVRTARCNRPGLMACGKIAP